MKTLLLGPLGFIVFFAALYGAITLARRSAKRHANTSKAPDFL